MRDQNKTETFRHRQDELRFSYFYVKCTRLNPQALLPLAIYLIIKMYYIETIYFII